MSMSTKIAANAQPYLEDGEVVQGAFAGQPTLLNRAGSGGYRCVVATDRRILVFRSGSISQTVVKELVATVPRETPLGEPSGVWHDLTLGDVFIKVHRRYFPELRQIDAHLPR